MIFTEKPTALDKFRHNLSHFFQKPLAFSPFVC